MESYAFISYAHKDGVLEAITSILSSVGIRNWNDTMIPKGSMWRKEIAQKIEQSTIVIVIWTEVSVQSDFVKDEVFFAKEKKKPILQIRIDKTELPSELMLSFSRGQQLCINREDLLIRNDYRHRVIVDAINDVVPLSKLKLNRCDHPQLVVFDFDGTLVNPCGKNTWELLWESVNYNICDCDDLQEAYFARNWTYQQWCDQTAAKFRERNMDYECIKKVADQMKSIGHLEAFLNTLTAHGIHLVILSGSVRQVIELVLKDLTRLFLHIEANDFLFDDRGKLTHIHATQYNFEKKADYIIQLATKLNIPSSHILFVGNSINDKYAYLSGAKTLLINPLDVDYTDRHVWDWCVRKINDIRMIFPFIIETNHGENVDD